MLAEGKSVDEVRAWLGASLLGAAPVDQQQQQPQQQQQRQQQQQQQQGAVATELGYVVLRTPSRLAHLRGHHEVGWHQLLARLGIQPADWPTSKGEFHIRLYRSEANAAELWTSQRLRLPMPLFPA